MEGLVETKSVMIHLRFAPNGTVVEIGERPADLTPQQWFDMLANKFVDAYQAYSGGRGVFRLPVDDLESFKNEATKTAA